MTMRKFTTWLLAVLVLCMLVTAVVTIGQPEAVWAAVAKKCTYASNWLRVHSGGEVTFASGSTFTENGTIAQGTGSTGTFAGTNSWTGANTWTGANAINTASVWTVGTGGTLTMNGTSNLVKGAATGYAIARGSQSVTGTATIASGLTTIVAVTGSIQSPSASAVCVGLIPSSTNIGAMVYSFTTKTNNTLVTSGTAKVIDWVAIGTK